MHPVFTEWGSGRPTLHLSRTSALFDAFGRLRVGQLETLFDSKLSYGKLPILWDEVVSANASSTHVEVDSCVNMAVTANGAFCPSRHVDQRDTGRVGLGDRVHRGHVVMFRGIGNPATGLEQPARRRFQPDPVFRCPFGPFGLSLQEG